MRSRWNSFCLLFETRALKPVQPGLQRCLLEVSGAWAHCNNNVGHHSLCFPAGWRWLHLCFLSLRWMQNSRLLIQRIIWIISKHMSPVLGTFDGLMSLKISNTTSKWCWLNLKPQTIWMMITLLYSRFFSASFQLMFLSVRIEILVCNRHWSCCTVSFDCPSGWGFPSECFITLYFISDTESTVCLFSTMALWNSNSPFWWLVAIIWNITKVTVSSKLVFIWPYLSVLYWGGYDVSGADSNFVQMSSWIMNPQLPRRVEPGF